MKIMKKAFSLTKNAVKWYLKTTAANGAITPTGMIPYNYFNK